MSQTLAADIEPVTRPKISFAGVNKFYGNNRSGAATTLALDDFSLGIAPEESQRGPQTPGLGAMPDIQALERYKTWSGKTA